MLKYVESSQRKFYGAKVILIPQSGISYTSNTVPVSSDVVVWSGVSRQASSSPPTVHSRG